MSCGHLQFQTLPQEGDTSGFVGSQRTGWRAWETWGDGETRTEREQRGDARGRGLGCPVQAGRAGDGPGRVLQGDGELEHSGASVPAWGLVTFLRGVPGSRPRRV